MSLVKTIVCAVLVLSASCLVSCQTYEVNEGYQAQERSFFSSSMVLLDEMVSAESIDLSASEHQVIPEGYRPWWTDLYKKPLFDGKTGRSITIDELIPAALESSFQIQTFSDIPLIRNTTIAESKGQFETRFFVKGRYDNINEPVGSTLRTGGADIFEEESYSIEAGLKKKIITGGQLEIAQKFGFTENNSEFFVPTNQARTRLSLNYTQPLLYGAGKAFNESQTVLAEIDSRVGYSELRRQAESFILELNHAYWSLYLERTYLIQKRALGENARRVLALLKERSDVDTLGSQIARVQAEYSNMKSDLVRAEKAVRNAESRLRSLTNIPLLYQTRSLEFIPMSSMGGLIEYVDVAGSVKSALVNRPEIEQLLLQCQASEVREEVAKKQLLPMLNLVFEAYYAGLAGDYDTDGAIDSQTSGDLSYMAGVIFDTPLSKKSSRARHQRRKLEVRQLRSKLRTTAETIVLEVQMSARELEAAHLEGQGRYEAMIACRGEYADLHKRESVMLEGGSKGSQHLERLLGSLQRLTEAEGSFALSTVTYELAYWNLERAKGMLLKKSGVALVETEEDGIPKIQLKVITTEEPDPS